MTLTVEELRGFIISELDDDALGLLLGAAYEAIDAAIGTGTEVREYVHPGPGDRLMLSRSASAITALSECDVELADDDFLLYPGGQFVRRLITGTNPSRHWRGRVDVTYTPITGDDEKDRGAVALVKLDLDHNPGLTAQRLGEWSETYRQGASDYQTERDSILAGLGGPGIPFI